MDVDKAVKECREIANQYLKNWKMTDPKWKTVEGCAYLRLSTDEQVLVEKGSLEQQVYMAIQETESRSKQKSKNYKITHFYIEPGVSGRKSDRKEFLSMKRAIRLNQFGFVAFKEISRIARDSQLWKEFFNLCHQKNCEVIIRGLPIDPNDPSQILQLDILAVFAEYEAQVTAKRIRESVFSAMITSGKFNSTHQILGLDPLVVNAVRKVGFYTANEKQLNTVKWIMETFVKYGSHQKTLEVCAEHGVVNADGRPFKRHSLINLLTNTRYIGKWHLNKENKTIEQDSLPEHRRYHEIDLPHGTLIPLDLWVSVQKTIAETTGNMGKINRVTRIYPLSGGILKLSDGSTFKGTAGTGSGKDSRCYYYYNEKNKIRVRCEIFEDNIKEVVGKIINNSPELQKAIIIAGKETQDNIQIIAERVEEAKRAVSRKEIEKSQYFKNLQTLLKDEQDQSQIAFIKNEFKEVTSNLNTEIQTLKAQLTETAKSMSALKENSFSWGDISKHAKKVQELLLEKDPQALKRAYHSLFKEIIVGLEDKQGKRTLTYVLKNHPGSFEDEYRLNVGMVEAISRSQPIDTTQRNFRCPSKVQVGAVFFDDINGEKK
jgi:DNA invertase Pin-like site-specific DNA recombinase